MRRGRWLALAGVLVGFGVWLAAASWAWGDTITPICTTDQGGSQPCQPGWYVSAVHLSWTWDPVSGSGTCADTSYNTDKVQTVSCTVNWGQYGYTAYYTIQVEISTPTAIAVLTRPPDFDGWYNHPVGVSIGFQTTPISGTKSCTAPTYAGADTFGTTLSGSCTDNAGKVAYATSQVFKYDSTPPTITAWTASRHADHDGWYNHPVAFRFTGIDATSGIGSCTSPTYAGPGSANASVVGTCTDRAGNVAALAVPLRYDSTPPRLNVASGTGDHVVALRWEASSAPAPLTSLKITRTSSTGGGSKTIVEHPGNGSYTDTHVSDFVRYRYTIRAVDQAGNVSVRTVTAVPGPRLLWPPSGIHLTVPPLLLWTPVRGADYYNVQLYRGGEKVLSTWPVNDKLQLRHTWSFRGHRFKLKPGIYHWYVWPGYGARAAARYGRLVGRGTFVIVRR